jgi:hypothetical protein
MNSNGCERKRFYSSICLHALRKTTKTSMTIARCPDRYWNQEYKSEALPLETTCSLVTNINLLPIQVVCVPLRVVYIAHTCIQPRHSPPRAQHGFLYVKREREKRHDGFTEGRPLTSLSGTFISMTKVQEL